MRDIVLYAACCSEGAEHDVAYHLMACALREEYGIESLPEIARGKRGKPFFPEWPTIHFNISHSHGAAVAVFHDHSIGIDIEKLRPAPKRLSAGLDDLSFFRMWTAKEAAVKRRGGSIAEVLCGEFAADPLCSTMEDLLPGWIVTVCPSVDAPIRIVCLGEK